MNRIFAVCCLLLVGATLASAQDGKTVAIEVDRIHAGAGVTYEPGFVLIRDGKILAVGPDISIPQGTPVMRRKGMEMTAGMIDAAASGLLEANATEQASEVIAGTKVADGVDVGAKRFLELAQDGVTAVFATPATDAVIGAQGAIYKTGELARLLRDDGDCKLTLNHDPAGRNGGPRRGRTPTFFTRRPTSQMGVIYVARDAFMMVSNAIYAKESLEKGSTEAVIARVLTGKHGLRVRAEQQYEISAAMRMADEFGFRFILEAAPEAWRMCDELKAAEIPVVLGPLRELPGSNVSRRGRPAHQPRDATATVLKKAGVSFALTADNLDGEYGLGRQAGFARRHGLGFEDTLAAVTTVPAKLLGLEKSLGRIAVGYDADLVIWSGEPFAPTSAIVAVFVDGRLVR